MRDITNPAPFHDRVPARRQLQPFACKPQPFRLAVVARAPAGTPVSEVELAPTHGLVGSFRPELVSISHTLVQSHRRPLVSCMHSKIPLYSRYTFRANKYGPSSSAARQLKSTFC